MARKVFEMWLDDLTYIVVDLVVSRGRVVGFVVRLILVTEQGPVDIVRYDTAHGMPHRDLLDRSGRTIRKDWLYDFGFGEAMTCAIEDFKQHYPRYVRQWQNS